MEDDEDIEDVAKRRKLDADSVRAMNKQSIESKLTEEAIQEEQEDMERPSAFYNVEASDLKKSPDFRAKRELDLLSLATRIRDYPTLPADPENSSQVWQSALSDEMAIELPTVHCSFRDCAWCGQTEEERDSHIITKHKKDLIAIAMTLPLCFSEKARLLSVYNEALAVKTRQGAPFTSYAVQRRSVNNYMTVVVKSSIQAPMCLICACKFPYVSSRKKMKSIGEFPLTQFLPRTPESNVLCIREEMM